QGDAEDPLGPLESINFNYNKIFGVQFFTTWNVYDLIGVSPIPGTRWRLNADYLSERGPALGTDYEFAGKNMFGIPNRYEGLFKAYGIHDAGADVLGGERGSIIFLTPTTGIPITHPEWRGRVFFKENVQDLPAGFMVQAQLSVLSDKNYLEQFYQPEFNN